MIFVTIGTPPQGFPRLIKKMDEIAKNIDEDIIMQIGYEEYIPINAKFFRFLNDKQQIDELYKKARVVVSHGGIGSIIDALRAGTPVIAVPRLKIFGEDNDEHQLDTVQIFEKEGLIRAIYDINDLPRALYNHHTSIRTSSGNKELIYFLKNYLKR